MKLFNLFYVLTFTAFVTALPYNVGLGRPVANTKFQIKRYLDTEIAASGDLELYNAYHAFSKRANSSDDTLAETLILALNNSGLIFLLLDAFADNPTRVQSLVNFTTGALSGSSSLNLSLSSAQISKLLGALNGTQLLSIIEDSGIITSVLDGFLLDVDYRPVLVNLTYRILDSNKNLLLYLFESVFAKSSKRNLLERRASYSGSLEDFIINIVADVAGSSIVTSVINDTVVGLNDTGVLVYTLKRIVANVSYQNATALLIDDVIASGALSGFNISSYNITGLITSALSNPAGISSLIGTVLSGNSTGALLAVFDRYSGALLALLSDLEATGIFEELNNYIFPSTSSSVASSTKKANAVSTSGGTKSTSTSSTTSGAVKKESSATPNISNGGLIKSLLMIQTFVLGGFLMSI